MQIIQLKIKKTFTELSKLVFTHLTHVVLTIIYVDGAVLALKTRKTLASVISIVINARSVIFTRVI